MKTRLTPFARLMLTLLISGLVALTCYLGASYFGLIGAGGGIGTTTVGEVDLPTAPRNASVAVTPAEMPGTAEYTSTQPQVRMLHWAWNAHMGLLFANGGTVTTDGSIMARHGLSLKLTRQDDVAQMQAELVKFAKRLKDGEAQPTDGAHFVTIMGDGAAVFLQGVNSQLEELGPEYRARIVGIAGRSLGEDKFMGLPAWRSNPQLARGAVVAAYLRDGDWNIVVKWCGDNGIPVNSDDRTYDPDAMNFVAADDYIDAAKKYISNYTEERPVVRNGRRTGETQRIAISGVATWTPGDQMVASGRGGLVSIVSTREYSSQMPCVIIGIDRWMQDNRPAVEKFLRAVFEGADQVKSYSAALQRAAEISAQAYGEQDAAYWLRYYKGVTETDKQGLLVELGGSGVCNLGDNCEIFGLAPGSTNVYGAVYKVFGDIVVRMYPDLVPAYPPFDQAVDLSYLQNIVQTTQHIAAADVVHYPAGSIAQPVSSRSWNIEFETGRATFTPQAEAQLRLLLNDLVIAANLKVQISGHTDNIGNSQSNRVLSEQRAQAVANWLRAQAANSFPESRIEVKGMGQDQPIAPNDTETGRAHNRRVTIVLGL